MDDLREIVRALAGPLEVERRQGYSDSAVLGASLAEYARSWAQRAEQKLESSSARRQCAGIRDLLADYGQCDGKERAERVEAAQRLLSELSGKSKPPRRPRKRVPRQEEPFSLDDALASGARRRLAWVKRLAKLGIETNRDLLYHFPRDYAPLRRIADLVDGERAAVVAECGPREEAAVRQRRGHRLIRCALEVSDESGKAWVVSFARLPRAGARAKAILASPLALNHPEGTRLLIEGVVQRAGRLIEIQHNSSERLEGGEQLATGALVPIYPLTDGVYQGQVRPAVRRLLKHLPEDMGDPLPHELRSHHDFPVLRQALADIHWPASEGARDSARRRLAFGELLTLQLALAQRKRDVKQPGSGLPMPPRGDVVALLEEVLPFSLTRAQQRVIAEVASDMAADTPMYRLIQGDVGSGKTVLAAGALMIAIQNGYQGALMAPTELLAEQHYLVLSRMLDPLGVEVELLTGSVRARDREQAYRRIADGRAQLIVGTHALIQGGLDFHRLGLVIVDEQHRFGVRQRADLRLKAAGTEPHAEAPVGARCHMLVMTATPIPRTLALTAYGDLDLSILDEMPPGRTPVKTSWMPLQRQREAFGFVRRQVAEGRQTYVVCPLIEESDNLQAEAASELAQKLQEEVFPELQVGLLHGAMPVAQKDAAMQAFRAGDIDVLCATTVIEVGVDVPNATVMLVLNAERFGLAQLHQLRGRVGRGAHESHCILLSDRRYDPSGALAPGLEEPQAQTRRRLRVMLEECDGFAIAEQDLLLRGPGEFYGTRQHGLPELHLAHLLRDVHILEEAQEAARQLVSSDPNLERPEHGALRDQVTALRARMESVAG